MVEALTQKTTVRKSLLKYNKTKFVVDALGDLWSYKLSFTAAELINSTETWKYIVGSSTPSNPDGFTSSTTFPGNSVSATMLFDSANNSLILFGGGKVDGKISMTCGGLIQFATSGSFCMLGFMESPVTLSKNMVQLLVLILKDELCFLFYFMKEL